MAEHSKRDDVIRIPIGLSVQKIRKNPWILSTIVLVILLIVLVFSKSDGVSGTVSVKEAGQNLVTFIDSLGKGSAQVVSSEKEGALYKINVDYNGQTVPVYVTLDGKYLISQPVPLTASADSGATPTPQPSNVPKTDKPKVELFVMSYCPYGTQIEKGILPVLGTLKDKIDFKIRWVYYAMHGQKEVDENVVQYCIQKDQNSKYLAYLQCFLADGNTTRCQKETGIDSAKLNSCISATDKEFSITKNFNDKSSWLSGQFPKFDIDKADNQKYGVQGSPTLVINGVQAQSGRSPAALLSTICSSFANAPAECASAKLATDTPNPGIGYSGSAADSAAANCIV